MGYFILWSIILNAGWLYMCLKCLKSLQVSNNELARISKQLINKEYKDIVKGE